MTRDMAVGQKWVPKINLLVKGKIDPFTCGHRGFLFDPQPYLVLLKTKHRSPSAPPPGEVVASAELCCDGGSSRWPFAESTQPASSRGPCFIWHVPFFSMVAGMRRVFFKVIVFFFSFLVRHVPVFF